MDFEFEKGTVIKSASIALQPVTEEELAKINKYAIEPLKAEDVFTFKTVAGDNMEDDRNFEPFTLQALKDMVKLYPGRTIIKNHNRSTDNQIGRIYDAELRPVEGKSNSRGEPCHELILKAYMVRTETNADLIKEIAGGIKKEVSTGVMPSKAVCSICGVNNMVEFCSHWPGKKCKGQTCLFWLDGVKSAHELSFVAVPAQPRAGVIKGLYEGKPEEDTEALEKEVLTRLDLVGAFRFSNQYEKENKNNE